MLYYGKEIKRFLKTPVLIVNSGFSIVLVIAFTIILCCNFEGMLEPILRQEDLGVTIEQVKQWLPKIFYGFIVMTSCMTSITSSLISLEGKSYYITKSLPVLPEKILFAKVFMSNIISVPIILICDVIFFAVFKIAILDMIFIIIASILVPTFTAMLGILVNLKYPKMNATSDTEIVKQSMSSGIAVMLGFIVGSLAIAWLIIGNKEWYIGLELIAFGMGIIILGKFLKTYGVKRLRQIDC